MDRSSLALASALQGRKFIIEGLPGAGKTTLVKALASTVKRCLNIPARAACESMRDRLLNYFCERPKERAALTQMTMLSKRVMEMLEATYYTDSGAVVFMDRSLDGDRAFALLHHEDGNMSDEEMVVYHDERDAMIQRFRELPGLWGDDPEAALVLRVPDKVLKERLVHRNHPGEVSFYTEVDPEYLQRLGRAYEKAMTESELRCPIVTIDDDCLAILQQLVDAVEHRNGAKASSLPGDEDEFFGETPFGSPAFPLLSDLYPPSQDDDDDDDDGMEMSIEAEAAEAAAIEAHTHRQASRTALFKVTAEDWASFTSAHPDPKPIVGEEEEEEEEVEDSGPSLRQSSVSLGTSGPRFTRLD
jgi:deoxyadenosine/deoxycytidine kinase